MKVECLLDKIDSNNFLEDYLKACGVKNVQKYLKANTFDNVWDYPGMEETVRRLNIVIKEKEKIGILVD